MELQQHANVNDGVNSGDAKKISIVYFPRQDLAKPNTESYSAQRAAPRGLRSQAFLPFPSLFQVGHIRLIHALPRMFRAVNLG